MKQWIALLSCVWLLAMGAFSVSADSTTASWGDVTQTEIVTQTTVFYEKVEVEVLEKVSSPYPSGTALVCIIVGGFFVLLAIALLCVYLFAFPRWGLMTAAGTTTAEDAAVKETAENEGETPSSVSLEDLF